MELQETTVYKLKKENMEGDRVVEERLYMRREEAEEHDDNFSNIKPIKAITDGFMFGNTLV